jgi:hypothetical protein
MEVIHHVDQSKNFILKTSDIAKKFNVTQMTVINWTKRGLPYKNIGVGTKYKNYRFCEQDVEEWINKQQK